ncbi:MAG TPA: hypothetical protein VE053_05125 [Allosphingosinicella sp.]|nr:hypothetical protein [Allosphingosinicella sp.]
MIKKSAAAMLVTAALSMPAPAYANHGEPMYYYYYHSDSTYSVDVGMDTPGCSNHGVVYTLSGLRTPYVTSEHVGYCANDGYGPVLEPVGAS